MFNKEDIIKEYSSNQEYSYIDMKWEYVGPIGMFKGCKMPRIAKKFYNVWKGEGVRCGNPSYHSYNRYGGVGVKRVYSSRAFISWAINEMLTRNEWYEPTVSRFNDSGNYEFGNIKLIEKSENSAEITITDAKRKSAAANIRENQYRRLKGYSKVLYAMKTAKQILEELNDKFPSVENELTLAHLSKAIEWQEERTRNREKRNVEGTNQA